MKPALIESRYSNRSTFFGNPYEDPGEEFEIDPDDPIGLVLLSKQREMEDEIRCESLVRNVVNEIIRGH
jgi:hypothetical protein